MASSYPAPYTGSPVASLGSEARLRFIKRAYGHLFASILAFTAIELLLFTTGAAEGIARAMLDTSWLLVLGGFMIVGLIASSAAARARTLPVQYAALAAYVVAEAIIFVPLLFIADAYAPGTISSAALVTLLGFAGLTAVAIMSGKDFSFLRSIIMWAGIGALLLIVSSLIFGFQLGTIFSVAMIALAGASILYSTSRILRSYPEDRYVSASLELFASVALMFWYVLRLMLARE